MALRPKRLALYAGAALALLGAAGVWRSMQADRTFRDPRNLLSRFPAEDSLVLSADVTLLRRGGFLNSSKATPEPEYKAFVDGTGFDYRRDLDSVVAAFSGSGTYFIVQGRFDWKKLEDYAQRNGGSCYQQLCRMQGSTPERRISFLPLRSDAMALAVSTSDLAATNLTRPRAPIATPLPGSPVWISVPGAELRRQAAVAPNLRTMLMTLGAADRILITFDATSSGIEARLDATCRTDVDAKVLASQLRLATSELKEAQSRSDAAKKDDLITFLTSGAFEDTGKRVTGAWPLPKTLLDSVLLGL